MSNLVSKDVTTARSEFLNSVWERYPSADESWIDARTYVRGGVPGAAGESKMPAAGGVIVAGRLQKSATSWVIESGGERLSFVFHTSPRWLRPCSFHLTERLFEAGDIVAIEISAKGAGDISASFQNEYAVAEAILLLTPSFAGVGEASADSAQWTSRFTIGRSEQWALFLREIREFFLARDFIEAQTPTLVPSPGTEPFLDPFSTERFLGSHTETLYLPTSPEFHLKQLLARGWTKIFELKTCFRNGEMSAHHQPEFLMLEWYRAYSNLAHVARDVDELFQKLALVFARPIARLKQTTISELFAAAFNGFALRPSTTREELADLASRHGVIVDASDSFDDVFFRLFLEKIEHSLGQDGPLLVSNYPPSQAALSRLGAHGFAERFEIYWQGLELANAFHELNDPIENEKRFAIDALTKQQLGKTAVPRDENLVRALKAGLPPSGGIALGVDRLFMALFEISEIEETRAFPALRP